MGNSEQKPNSTQPVSHTIKSFIEGMGDRASADSPALTPQMRMRASEAAKQVLRSKYSDITSEIDGIDVEATELLGDYEILGDEKIGEELEAKKKVHLNALVEKSNLEEMIDLIDPTPKTK